MSYMEKMSFHWNYDAVATNIVWPPYSSIVVYLYCSREHMQCNLVSKVKITKCRMDGTVKYIGSVCKPSRERDSQNSTFRIGSGKHFHYYMFCTLRYNCRLYIAYAIRDDFRLIAPQIQRILLVLCVCERERELAPLPSRKKIPVDSFAANVRS